MAGKDLEVLLVEDDEADVELTLQSLNETKLLLNINVVNDGVKAMEYLHNDQNKRPDLVILDLNMPKKDGYETLLDIRADERLRDLPVVMLTTSDTDIDVKRCYREGANSYVTKPIDFMQFQKVVNEIADFWFTVVKLPPDGQE